MVIWNIPYDQLTEEEIVEPDLYMALYKMLSISQSRQLVALYWPWRTVVQGNMGVAPLTTTFPSDPLVKFWPTIPETVVLLVQKS